MSFCTCTVRTILFLLYAVRVVLATKERKTARHPEPEPADHTGITKVHCNQLNLIVALAAPCVHLWVAFCVRDNSKDVVEISTIAMCVRDAFEAALEQRARHLQAIQVHERKATDEFRGLREEIDRLLPDDRYWKWRSGIGKDDDAVLLFDADALTEDPNSKDLHLDFLDMMMVCEDIAVVIKNTIDLDRSLWSAKSILDQLSQRDYRHHKCFKYKYDESCEPTGFKYRKQRGVVQDVDIAEISKQFDKKDWRSGDTFYFVKDLYLSDHLRSLATDFEVGFKLKEVLPGGSNCGMNNNVCVADWKRVYVCRSAFLTVEVLPLFLSRRDPRSLGSGICPLGVVKHSSTWTQMG